MDIFVMVVVATALMLVFAKLLRNWFKFRHLEFEKLYDGVGARKHFDNGYGVSVIRHRRSYGGDEGYYELAVLEDDSITYNTPITSDVVGWLSEDDVTEVGRRVERLDG